ncbi:MAG: type II secretion system protein [bacterium]|nr:type II secretion system protein [bacterium]
MKKNEKTPAFTFIEILLSMTILAISIGLVTSWTNSSLSSAELQTITEELTGLIRHQEMAAHTQYQNAHHGIRIEANQYTTFIGNDFDTSAQEDRQTFTFPTAFSIENIAINGGGADIVFDKGSGETEEYGSFQILHHQSNDLTTISVSPIGLTSWQ